LEVRVAGEVREEKVVMEEDFTEGSEEGLFPLMHSSLFHFFPFSLSHFFTSFPSIQCGSFSRNTPYTYVPSQALRKVTMMTE
jgi:hypothetical protein